MGDNETRLSALWEWTHQYGAALKPPGPDTYGEGMRDAKEQVQRLLSGASPPAGELAAMRAQRDEEKARRENCGQDGVCAIAPGCDRHWAERNAELCAQRDEARELVRRYVEGDCLYDELNEERACNAVLRWDEEAKR